MQNKANNGARAFTLIELLIVISVISILLTFSSPALFNAAKVYKFRRNQNIISEMLHSVRSLSLNNKAVPMNHEVGDIDSDGAPNTLADHIPYAYNFEIYHETLNNTILRTYADFNKNNSTYDSTTDYLLDEIDIPAASAKFSYNMLKLALNSQPPFPSIAMSTDNSQDYKFTYSYASPFGDYSSSYSTDENVATQVWYTQITVTDSNDTNRTSTFQILPVTGIVTTANNYI